MLFFTEVEWNQSDVQCHMRTSKCDVHVRCLRQWVGTWASVHIKVKELLPMVVACVLWGASWQETMVLCRSDNMAAVEIVNLGKSKNGLIMQLIGA